MFMDIGHFVKDLIIVLVSGAASGVVCKRWSVSLVAGYLVVGALIGHGGLGLVLDPGHELELIAEAGAMLLLFSVAIEFSLDELSKLGRFFFIGGAIQMALVAVPLTGMAWLLGASPPAAILAGAAGAFSSTVLVFRALSEAGHAESAHGRRAIAVLLFQDAALVPLLLLAPLITGNDPAASWDDYVLLAVKAASFLVAVIALQRYVSDVAAARLAAMRSVETIVLVTIALLCGLSWIAYLLELPPAVGAFAAGVVLSGNRISKQIDAIVLPFRETFAAVFFVTLGMLLQPGAILSEPLVLGIGVAGIVGLKTLGAACALRCVGLSWRAALGMGLGLAQVGEFSFLLVSRGVAAGIIGTEDYNRMLFIAVVTLIATPLLLRQGLRWAGAEKTETRRGGPRHGEAGPDARISRALVVGIGPIGGQVASRMETVGIDVALIDLSPVNLHGFAQAGFSTHTGDARDREVLLNARVSECELAVVCVPKDAVAIDIVKSLRQTNEKVSIVVRCRFQSFVAKLLRAGATAVVSEEQEAAGPLMKQCEMLIGRGRAAGQCVAPHQR